MSYPYPYSKTAAAHDLDEFCDEYQIIVSDARVASYLANVVSPTGIYKQADLWAITVEISRNVISNY